MSYGGWRGLGALRTARRPDMPVTLYPADQATAGERARIINEAYADYFVPTRISESQMRRMDQIYDIDLTHSVVARAGNRWVGMAMLARRGTRGWVSSVGVTPEWRRHGVARAMMERVVEAGNALGLAELTLEVIDRNDPARCLYESLGFRSLRELLTWRRDAEADSLPAPDERLHATNAVDVLNRHYGWHVEPASWQRDAATLRYLAPQADAMRLLAPGDGAAVGYVVYSDLGERVALLDVAADPGRGWARTARSVVQALCVLHRGKMFSISNVPADDPLNLALAALGFLVTVRQHEMRLALGAGD